MNCFSILLPIFIHLLEPNVMFVFNINLYFCALFLGHILYHFMSWHATMIHMCYVLSCLGKMSCQVFYEVSFDILSCHVKWFLCLTMSHLIISMSVVSMSISVVSMSMSVVCIARRKVDCTCSYVNISRLNLAKLVLRNTTVCLRTVVVILWWQRNRRWRRWCRW